MPKSCSSQNNECISCGPILDIYEISYQDSQSIQGLTICQNKGYWTQTISAQSNEQEFYIPAGRQEGVNVFGCPFLFNVCGATPYSQRVEFGETEECGPHCFALDPTTSNQSSSTKTSFTLYEYNYFINKYGDILYYTDSSGMLTETSSSSSSATHPCTEQDVIDCKNGAGSNGETSSNVSANFTYVGKPIKDCPLESPPIKPGALKTESSSNSTNCGQTSQTFDSQDSEIFAPPGPVGQYANATCTSSSSCTNSKTNCENIANSNPAVTGTFPNKCASGGSTNNKSYSINAGYQSPKDLNFFYNIAKQIVNIKIQILEENKPQNCNEGTCGEGKDACWGSASSFSITDNNLDDSNAASTTAQKLKFKIAASKQGFDKTYKSVSGKVKFYYGGTGGKTPCCDDDFDGTVVKETGYSISAGSTFKNDYFASDAGDFDNDDQSHVGETISICYTVDNISFF